MNHQHSIVGVTTSVIEAALLVFLGVAAANLDSVFGWAGVLVIVVVLALTRYIAGVHARQDASREWLAAYIQDASNLERIIREITDHALDDPWTKNEMIDAIEYWYLDDLQNLSMWNRYLKQTGQEKPPSPPPFTSTRRSRLSWGRHPITTVRALIRRLERRLVRDPSHRLIQAVADLPPEEVATMVIKQGVENGFLLEDRDSDEEGRVTVKYQAKFVINLKDHYQSWANHGDG